MLYNDYYSGFLRGGFQVDSPVKSARASEMPRLAPPYTNGTREEPWQGGMGGNDKRPRGIPAGAILRLCMYESRGAELSTGLWVICIWGGLVIVKHPRSIQSSHFS